MSSSPETRTLRPDTPDHPPELAEVDPDRIVEADVRAALRSGEEPFDRIMAARERVPEDGVLVVRAIFEPAPLYRVMAGEGFAHWTERLADDDWRVWFYRGEVESTAPASCPGPEPSEPASGQDPEPAMVLDVRDLEPPEPMVKTLEALEQLPEGGSLLQVNARVPRFLLPRLEERGFVYAIEERGPTEVHVLIRHAD